VCDGGDTDKVESNAISMILRANAIRRVGLRE
jgi:hypothetical protein